MLSPLAKVNSAIIVEDIECGQPASRFALASYGAPQSGSEPQGIWPSTEKQNDKTMFVIFQEDLDTGMKST